ncbi:hypothetical protein OBBRIDRAFT_890667 [Obba rivulosa]|uniref:Uncharacterized protein n=1 Tax=Obba rivulosa TaxID=1052685 RepID=A0A8E2AVJ8_9APHY|nr:hypothetical protein OBBRIDRAFT_890667 [Obba rivulosa]
MHFSSLFALLAIVPVALCAPGAESNAVDHGHHPHKTDTEHRHHHHHHETATHQEVKRSAAAQPANQALTGSIEVQDEQNKFLGFLSFDTQSINGLVPQKPNNDVISFNPQSEPFALNIVQSGQPTKVFVGGAGNDPLGPSSANIVPLDVVPLTPAGSGPVPPQGAESTIWSLNGQDNELTAQWVNKGGQRPQTSIAFDSKKNELFFTGDVNAHNKQANTNAELVRFFFVKKCAQKPRHAVQSLSVP